MNGAWKLEDHTGTNKGYMRITFEGKRVADVFPYGAGVDAEWTIAMAMKLVEHANARDNA